MKKTFRVILAAAAACLACSCSAPMKQGREVIPLVREILDGRAGSTTGLLASYSRTLPSGEIFIIGSEEDCASLSATMLLMDEFDNIDGSFASDRLPDFAGERIASIVDTVYAPYGQYADSVAAMRLREITVRLALTALDTLYCGDRFGFALNAVKPRAKMLVLPSPRMEESGKFDLDSLFSAAGVTLPVIFSSRLATDWVISRHGEDAMFGTLEAAVPSDTSAAKSPLRHYLERYAADGGKKPISAVILAGRSLNVEEIREEYGSIVKGETWEDFELSKLLADDFEVVDCVELTSRTIYRTLRAKNLFTHEITYPMAHSYVVADNGGIPILKKNVQN